MTNEQTDAWGDDAMASEEDRRALLAAYDALAAAARKVCCGRCGLFPDEQSHDECTADCPDCADLRKLLEGER